MSFFHFNRNQKGDSPQMPETSTLLKQVCSSLTSSTHCDANLTTKNCHLRDVEALSNSWWCINKGPPQV